MLCAPAVSLRPAFTSQTRVYLSALPGTFIYADTPLLWVAPTAALKEAGTDSAKAEKGNADRMAWSQPLQAAFSMGNERTFEQDPRFGLVVLSEIASRALSPAVPYPRDLQAGGMGAPVRGTDEHARCGEGDRLRQRRHQRDHPLGRAVQRDFRPEVIQHAPIFPAP